MSGEEIEEGHHGGFRMGLDGWMTEPGGCISEKDLCAYSMHVTSKWGRVHRSCNLHCTCFVDGATERSGDDDICV